MKKAKILLLEDDLNLNETIKEYLEDEGFEVDAAYDSDEAFEKIYENSYDILLLDVMVPGENGFEILKKIEKEIPTIFITSLNSVEDLEKGYESGCDDYIRKPFALKELKLRVETLLKREFETKDDLVKIDKDLYFDLKNLELYKNKNVVSLKPKEKKLLKLFLKNKNRSVSHEQIYNTLWDYEETPSDTSLRTYIKNLRKILGKDKIVSIKKHGYRFITE